MIDQTFERIVTLRDGRVVRLRAIRPSDEAALREGFARLSRLSRYQRFHGTFNELPSTVVHALTHVDGIDHCAVVAVDASADGDEREQRGLGVARFVRVPGQPERAELALTIADDAQGLGLGTRLLRLLAAMAQERGLTTFVAYVLRDNAQARALFERVGAERLRGVHPQLTYELPIGRLLQPRQGVAA
jgi:RimJ/RimL family protein N-acetyltransferase